MENDDLIFTNINTPLINKYTKHIVTARILIFILAAISLFMAGIGFILKPEHPGEREDSIVLLICFGSMGLIYLVLGVISIKKPLTSFIITSIFTTLFLLLFIDFSLASLAYVSNAEISVYCITVVLILALIFFITRGAIYAKKHKNLMLIYS